MKLSGWGRYPYHDCEVLNFRSALQLQQKMPNAEDAIARGMGRSYGDSALADQVYSTRYLDHFLSLDQASGVLVCEAGTSLDEILQHVIPRGWFLSVTPGTRYVSVGGAIASDVHGKNHHVDGCFSQHVISFQIMLANGDVLECSKNRNTDLFQATCGGMGLTGVILKAELQLKKIKSRFIDQMLYKTRSFREALDLFDQYKDATYSVAWIDCLAREGALGRSHVMLGEHSEDQCDRYKPQKNPITVPVDAPAWMLNGLTIRGFNALYYHRVRSRTIESRVPLYSYFYPLDGLRHWNRLYGKNGFTQYQFVIPKQAGHEAFGEVLSRISASGRGSFLAVLKLFGGENQNLLSFPKEGYTLALDFKIDSGIFDFLNELDAVVHDYDGRVYLTKDCRLGRYSFRKGYPRWEQFAQVREKYKANRRFHSLQSKRLGI